MKRSHAMIAIALILVGIAVYTALIYKQLPDKMPIHWNIHGKPDGFADKKTAVLLMPGIILLMTAFLGALPAMTPLQFRENITGQTGDIYNYMMVVITGLMTYIHVMMLEAALLPAMDFNKVLFTGMFFFFGLLGNVMGKIRRNPWMGVKTPWTLASDKVWDPTHRLAGRLMVGSGLLGALLTLLGVNPVPTLIAFILAVLYPLLYSYQLYKRLEARGEL